MSKILYTANQKGTNRKMGLFYNENVATPYYVAIKLDSGAWQQISKYYLYYKNAEKAFDKQMKAYK